MSFELLIEGFTMPSINDLLMARPRLDVQISLAAIHIIIWHILFRYVFYPIVFWVITRLKRKKQFLELNRQTFKKMLNWDIGNVEEEQHKIVSEFECVIVQHFFGGMLCVPLAVGISHVLPIGMATAMACHGSLTEIGGEMADMMKRLYEIIFCGKEGRKKNPMSAMITLIVHHSAACSMVLPMNIFYSNNSYYAEMSMILQLAAFIAIFCQQYGFTLNVRKQEELTKMKILLSINLLVIIWSRVIRYTWLLIILMTTVWEDQNWLVLKLAIAPFICMTLFNVLVVMDSSVKFAKFAPMHVDRHSMDQIKDLAVESASSGRHRRTHHSFTGLTMSQKNWAKIKGVVRMGVIHGTDKITKTE